jgi:hypothetical protein
LLHNEIRRELMHLAAGVLIEDVDISTLEGSTCPASGLQSLGRQGFSAPKCAACAAHISGSAVCTGNRNEEMAAQKIDVSAIPVFTLD